MHRDLKPDNILIGENNNAKICDFGLAKTQSNDLQATSNKGTPLYAGPEVYEGVNYNMKCDVWSLGLILYELVTGSSPFKHIKVIIIKILEIC